MHNTEANINKLITHHIGNSNLEEMPNFSIKESIIKHPETATFLLEYFLSNFKSPDYFTFSHSVSLDLNPVYVTIKQIFTDPESFIPQSKNLANLLYDCSDHPNIKSGKMHLVLFDNIIYQDEICNAIGIFKSETDTPYLKIKSDKESFEIDHDFGYDLKKIDKACLIFETNSQDGFIVSVVDNVRKNGDAKYWVDGFLQLTPFADSYAYTKNFLRVTKDFVTNQIPEEFEIDKTDQIDILNRTMSFFKNEATFDQEKFEKEVFRDEHVIASFKQFDNQTKNHDDIHRESNFDISIDAVKKQSRIYKSVLKLDKNFHIYIHGSRDLIEKGIDPDGRKFYKIYYREEK